LPTTSPTTSVPATPSAPGLHLASLIQFSSITRLNMFSLSGVRTQPLSTIFSLNHSAALFVSWSAEFKIIRKKTDSSSGICITKNSFSSGYLSLITSANQPISVPFVQMISRQSLLAGTVIERQIFLLVTVPLFFFAKNSSLSTRWPIYSK